MTEPELQQYLLREYPQENARCEWKEFKNLKNSFRGNEKDDVISYVSAIANMEGGFLVVGVHDKTLGIVGTDTYNYDRQKAILRLTERCTNLSSEGLDIVKLRPAVVRVTWSLRDEHEDVIDYEHFTAPFILTVDQILAKVHNLTMREMPGGTMFPDVMQQYDDYSMREVLHNCIAHQDYTLQERINLVENPGFLYYANGGSFIPGSLQKALATHGPQRHYRNECLCNAMVNFNMIDIVGRGIRKIFNEQWKRHFPMPDYEIDAANKEVAVRLYGNAINEKYTKLLKENKDLSLEDCILLDAVQKGHRLNESDAKNLLERGLVEGEYPDLTISLSIARQTKQLPEYTKVKGLERDKIKQMALQFIQNADEEGTRREFVIEYLREALPARNTKEQNQRLVGNILAEMSNEGLVIQKDRNWYATTSKD